MYDRRLFLKHSMAGGLLSLSIPEIGNNIQNAERKIKLSEGDIILFQGDSITDADRNREIKDANHLHALGTGYVLMTASVLLCKYPEKQLKIFNRGISGNRVAQLSERWTEDCINLKPQIISILIGVNDFWTALKQNTKVSPDLFLKEFRELIDKTKQQLPDAKLIIGEPFGLKGVRFVDDTWYPAFIDYQAASREVAKIFDATFIPLQQIFDKALRSAPGNYWTTDGVHTNIPGAQLMGQAWLNTIRG